jgi:hypothetical protein
VCHDTTLLLGLPDVVVDRVELDPDGVRVVHVSTADMTCPAFSGQHSCG